MIRWRVFLRSGASENALGEIEVSDQRAALATARAGWPDVEFVVISLAELAIVADGGGYCRHVTRARAAS